MTGTQEKNHTKHEDTTVASITLQDLLGAGVHFGHQTRRWNPKMKRYIFTERNGIYIIDLQKTLDLLNKACNKVRETAAEGGHILFVGTKPQASSIILEEAERCGQFHVVNRWAGGMLTNYRTIRQSIKKLDHLEKMSTDGTYEHLTKKEILTIEKQREKLNYVLSGIRDMNRLPGLLIVVDTKKEKIAVNEAARLGIPICAIIDTNCDPDPIDFPIPGNDDAIRSIKVLLGALTDAVMEGIQSRADKGAIEEKQAAVRDAEKEERDIRRVGRRAASSDDGDDSDDDRKRSARGRGKAASKSGGRKRSDSDDSGGEDGGKKSSRAVKKSEASRKKTSGADDGGDEKKPDKKESSDGDEKPAKAASPKKEETSGDASKEKSDE